MSKTQDTATAADNLAYVIKHGIDHNPLESEAILGLINERWPDLHQALTALINARNDNPTAKADSKTDAKAGAA